MNKLRSKASLLYHAEQADSGELNARCCYNPLHAAQDERGGGHVAGNMRYMRCTAEFTHADWPQAGSTVAEDRGPSKAELALLKLDKGQLAKQMMKA
jgi:hypothetical protein